MASIEDQLQGLTGIYPEPISNSRNSALLDAEIVRDSNRVIHILGYLNIHLADIVQSHPLLEPGQKSSILRYLGENVASELGQVPALLSQNALDIGSISPKIGFAERALVEMAYLLEIEEVQNGIRVDLAFARLHRVEVWHACLKELSQLRGSPMMDVFASVEGGIDLFMVMLSGMDAIEPVERAYQDGSEAGSEDGMTDSEAHARCGAMLLPCCNQAVHGCIRVQKEQNKCPLCHQAWSTDEVARLVHERVHQLQNAVGTWDCERGK